MRMLNLSYLFMIFLSKFLITHSQIVLNTTEVSGSLFVFLSMGEPGQFFFHMINQVLNYTYVTPGVYKKDKSSTSLLKQSKESLYVELVKEEGSLIADTIGESSFNLTNFNFYIIPTAGKHFLPQNELGFGVSFKEDNYSIIHMLKNQSKISKLAYTIAPGEDDFNGKLWLGEFPQSEVAKYDFHTTCKVNSSHPIWGCTMKTVFYGDISYVFGNTKYDNTHKMYFQASQRHILAPDDFMKFLSKNVFSKFYGTGQCGYMEGINDYFECYPEVIDKLSKVFNFIMGDSVLVLKREELFSCLVGKCKFLIMGNRTPDTWVFGMDFMKHFTMTFDYENKDITFHSKEYNIKVQNLENSFRYVSLAKKLVVVALFGILFALIKIYQFYSVNKAVLAKKKKPIDYSDEEKGIELL